jgi:hypothetical protein
MEAMKHVQTEILLKLNFNSLSGITRTGSMGLISACMFKAPLIMGQR